MQGRKRKITFNRNNKMGLHATAAPEVFYAFCDKDRSSPNFSFLRFVPSLLSSPPLNTLLFPAFGHMHALHLSNLYPRSKNADTPPSAREQSLVTTTGQSLSAKFPQHGVLHLVLTSHQAQESWARAKLHCSWQGPYLPWIFAHNTHHKHLGSWSHSTRTISLNLICIIIWLNTKSILTDILICHHLMICAHV